MEGGRKDWNTHFRKKAGRKCTFRGNTQGTEDKLRIFKPEKKILLRREIKSKRVLNVPP